MSLSNPIICANRDLNGSEKYLPENQLAIIAAASNASLNYAMTDHVKLLPGQLSPIAEIFRLAEEKPASSNSDTMKSLTKELKAVLHATAAGTATRDAGIILITRKMRHYEIAAYGGLAQLAIAFGLETIPGY